MRVEHSRSYRRLSHPAPQGEHLSLTEYIYYYMVTGLFSFQTETCFMN